MLDILFIGAHPDDEGNICGTLIKARKTGKKVGILTLTKGEAGGFTGPEVREIEMQNAVKIIGTTYFKHMDFPDAGLTPSEEVVKAIIDVLVETRPRTVITTYPIDCHPDHIAVSQAVDRALFVAGLKEHMGDKVWNLKQVFYLSLDSSANSKKPDLIIDVSDVIDEKYAATKCHASQGVADPQINIAKKNGKMGGFEFGEALYRGVTRQHPIKLRSFEPLLLED